MTLDAPLRLALYQAVDIALAEDIGTGDITAQLIDATTTASAVIISREAGILCGAPWVDRVFHRLDPAVSIQWQVQDGQAVTSNTVICQLQGPARALLSGERTVNLAPEFEAGIRWPRQTRGHPRTPASSPVPPGC